MWVVAGVLLGLMVLVALAGFHTGPHTHVVAGILGVLAAAWLVAMAIDGRSAPVLYALLSADIVVSSGIAALAWKGLSSAAPSEPRHHAGASEGADGIALTPLTPDGIVRVRGEEWSAISRNGDVPVGARVQVIRAAGLRLEVWREDEVAAGELFNLNGHEDLDAALSHPVDETPPAPPVDETPPVPPSESSPLFESSPPAPMEPESKEASQ